MKVKINIDDKAAEEFVLNVLKTNGFTKNMERYIEYGEAMGGFVIKVYHDGKRTSKFHLRQLIACILSRMIARM